MATISFNSATLKSGNYGGSSWWSSTAAAQGKWNGAGAHEKTQVGLINFSNSNLSNSTAVSQIKFTFTFGKAGYGTNYKKIIKFYKCISTNDPKTGLGEYLGKYEVNSAYGNSQTITLTSGDLFNNLISHFKSSYGYKICIYNEETANDGEYTWTRNYLTISAAKLEITYENIYTLTINPNGGTMRNGDATTSSSFTTKFQYGVKTYIGNLTSQGTIPDNTPNKTGYSFNNFTFSNGSGGKNTNGDRFYFNGEGPGIGGSSTNSNFYIFNGDYAGNVTTTAQWTANTYTVTFNAKGGSVSTSSKTVTYNSTYGTLPIPTRTGYTFNGWYTASSGGSQKQSSTTVTTASDHTLYAQWTANIYTIALNPETIAIGSEGTKKLYFTYETNDWYEDSNATEEIIFIDKPVNIGLNFMGYWTKKNGEGEQIIDEGGKIVKNPNFFSKNTTIYAHWIDASSISINTNITSNIEKEYQEIYYHFNPSITGNYIIESSGSLDSRIKIYNVTNNQLAYDDDSGESTNFKLEIKLTKNTNYYIKIYAYSSYTGETNFSIIPKSTIKIYTNNGWKTTIPYIYTESGWKKTALYLYDGIDWKLCDENN